MNDYRTEKLLELDQLTETEAEDAAFETFVRELAARTDRQLVDLLAEPLDLEDAIGKPPDLAELLTEPPDLADAIKVWSFLVRKGGLVNPDLT